MDPKGGSRRTSSAGALNNWKKGKRTGEGIVPRKRNGEIGRGDYKAGGLV